MKKLYTHNCIKHPKAILLYLIALCSLLLCNEPIYQFINSLGIVDGLTLIKSSPFTDIMMLLLSIFVCLFIYQANKTITEDNCVILSVLSSLLLVTAITFRIQHREDCKSFTFRETIKYTDVIFLWFILCTYRCIKTFVHSYKEDRDRNNENHTKPATFLLYDDKDADDVLNRTADAQVFSDKILAEYNRKGATGVSVTGSWGLGKSWFLQRMSSYLESKGEICINYQPWIYGDNDLTRHFYILLEKELKKNGIAIHQLAQLIRDLGEESLGIWGKGILALQQLVSRDKDRESILQNIRESMMQSDKRIFVFIDDCDRLESDELLQILSLVRNTGDLPSLVYILGYDESQLKKILQEKGELSYIKKMINLSYILSPINDSTLSDFLLGKLSELFGEDCLDSIRKELLNIHIGEYLPTIREVKLFWNQFQTDFKFNEKALSTYKLCETDYCLLELLRYIDIETYNGLRYETREWLNIARDGGNAPRYVLREDKQKKVVSSVTERILKNLFRKGEVYEAEDLLGIANITFFDAYFISDLHPNLTPYSEIVDAYNNDQFLQKIPTWMSEGKRDILSWIGVLHKGKYCNREQLFSALSLYIMIIRNLVTAWSRTADVETSVCT